MNERIARMKQRMLNTPVAIGVEKLRIAAETIEQHANKPNFVLRAEILSNYLKKLSVFIPDDDLIAGVGAGHYNGSELDYEQGLWSKEEVEALKADTGSMYSFSKEEEEELYAINERLAKTGVNLRTSDYLAALEWDDPDMQTFLKSGVVLPVWKNRNSGATNGVGQTGIGLGPGFILMCPEYDRVLKYGLRAMIEECQGYLKELQVVTAEDLKKREYWTSVVKVFESFIVYANRNADEAERLAETCTDETRKKELLRMAAACRKVPEFPAENFYEALQSFWFIFLSMSSNTMSAGRIDQLLYPYYKKDREAGVLTDEEVLELLEVIRLKCMTFHTVRGGLSRGRHSGDSRWLNFIIGGCDAEGNDLSNELTMLFMDAAIELKVPNHTLTLRVNRNTPLEVVKKGMEVVKTGIGQPAFVSDESYMNYFMLHGFSKEDAADFAICGCLDAVIPGKSRTIGVKFVNLPQILDIFLHRGYCALSGEQAGIDAGDPNTFADYEAFEKAYFEEQRYFMGLAQQRANLDIMIAGRVLQDPLRSALMHDGLKITEEIQNRSFEPFDTNSTLMCVGGMNVINSLAAIRKLIFEDRKYTMEELLKALEADWEGFEEMRKAFLKAPKYGNNDPYADEIASRYYDQFDQDVELFRTPLGSTAVPSGISISAHQPAGQAVNATPDGRFAHEILSDGMISPEQGTDVRGPLAVFSSAMKIPQDRYQATLFNMKFHPSVLKSDEDLLKLSTVVKTYLTNGGKQIQMNVVDTETLLNAQKEPEKYRELVVRVAGYSTYFTTLTKMMQDEIIARTMNESIS